MLHLDLHFSCTQRLMTPVSPGIKDSSEDRVYAVFSSIFLLVDASVHLFAATYKSFVWTASQISRKNPPDYYKEAYSHFVKALRCIPVIPFGSLVGFTCPDVFQSKQLQEYLGWKSPLRNTSEITENNKVLEEELQSKNEEIERLKLQIDSLTRSSTSNALQDDPQSLATMANSTPSYTRSASSLSQSPEPLEMDLISNETVKSTPSYTGDITSLSSEDEFLDAEDPDELIERLTEELQLAKGETERLNKLLAKGLALFSTLKDRLPYNQLLLIKKFAERDLSSAISIYKYASDDLKKEIDDVFRKQLQADFCNLSNTEQATIVQVFESLLLRHNFSSLLHPIEAALSKVLDSLIQL